MVVAFDLEADGKAAPDINKPCIFLAGTNQQPAARARKRLEEGDGVLVAAMLAPHDTVNPQFRVSRRAAQVLDNVSVFFFRQSVLKCQCEINGGFVRRCYSWHGVASNPFKTSSRNSSR